MTHTFLLFLPFSLLILPLSIDWVQDTAAATTKWGDIGDWDVSGVKDFKHAFSKHRGEDGKYVENGNPKAALFVGTGLSKWTTTSVTSLYRTFYNAHEMNFDLSTWKTATPKPRCL